MTSEKAPALVRRYPGELDQLHAAGFVHRHIRRPSNQGGLHFDNVLLTEGGLRLIDVGISHLKEKVGEKIFQKAVELERQEIETFRNYFLNR